MTAIEHTGQDFGANSWLVDEMYGQYVTDPASVSESWREFFSDYRGSAPATFGHQPAPAAAAAPSNAVSNAVSDVVSNDAAATPAAVTPSVAPAPAVTAAPTAAAPVARDDAGEPIRGAGVAIAANMERSLTVPTATSFRNVPAKLLEVNRSVINGYRSRTGQGKVSFTHLCLLYTSPSPRD